jgi:N6-adenosine-specific RNA methylase IME4
MTKKGARRELAPVGGLFDERPIKLDGFILRAKGVDIVGRPSIEKWIAAMDFATATEQASTFWVGHLWNYAEGRAEWKEQIYQALTKIGRPITLKTLQNLGYITKNVTAEAQAMAPSMGHADVVAGLPPSEQVKWLEKAKSEELTVRDLRLVVRASRRAKIIDGQAVLSGMYRVLYSDNPWLYGDRPPSGVGQGEHYPGMSIEDQCKLPVGAHALPDSILFMWCTAPLILQNPGPREVAEAWGFTYKQQWIWDKVDGNYGHYSTSNHEVLTIWTRGSCLPDNPEDLPDSVIAVRKSRTHSSKPEEFRRLITKHWTRGPYLELFGRDKVDGWSVFGNDAKLWAEEAAS